MVTNSVASGYCNTITYDVQLSQLHNEGFSKGGINGKGKHDTDASQATE